MQSKSQQAAEYWAETGVSKAEAARHVGIARSTLREYLGMHPEFVQLHAHNVVESSGVGKKADKLIESLREVSQLVS